MESKKVRSNSVKKHYQLKVILILLIITLLSTSCENQNNVNSKETINERMLEEFLERNDQTFIEVIEFVPTEKNPYDLVVSYKADNESEYKRNEVAVVNLRKSYYKKVHNVHYTFHIYEAKTLDDFTFISNLMIPETEIR